MPETGAKNGGVCKAWREMNYKNLPHYSDQLTQSGLIFPESTDTTQALDPGKVDD